MLTNQAWKWWTHTYTNTKIIIAWCYIFNEHVLSPLFPPHVGRRNVFFHYISYQTICDHVWIIIIVLLKKNKKECIFVHLLFNFINFLQFIRFSLKILKIEFLLSIGSITSVVCPFFLLHRTQCIGFPLNLSGRAYFYISQNILLIVIKVIFYNNTVRNIRHSGIDVLWINKKCI